MIVLHATLQIDPDRREDPAEIETLVERTNVEPGTIEYRAAADGQDPNTIRFFERYEDENALEAHAAAEHYQAFVERLPAFLDGEPGVVRFDVDSATELDV